MARAEDNVIVVPGRRQWPRRDVVRGQKLSSFLVCTLETANHADCPDCIPDPFARRGLRAIIILALMAASYIRFSRPCSRFIDPARLITDTLDKQKGSGPQIRPPSPRIKRIRLFFRKRDRIACFDCIPLPRSQNVIKNYSFVLPPNDEKCPRLLKDHASSPKTLNHPSALHPHCSPPSHCHREYHPYRPIRGGIHR